MDWRFLLFLKFVAAETEFLLDTQRQTTELSKTGWKFPNNSKWLDVSSLDENGRDIRVLQVCSKSAANDNWAISPLIETRGARNIDLEIKYTIRSCDTMASQSAGFCRETFTIFLHQASDAKSPLPSIENNGAMWKKVDTVASGDEVRIETIALGPIYGFGIYLAFQDSGACMQLMHVKVSYKYCPPVTSEFGIFPVTHTGSSATSIINQEGKCVENARSTGSRSTPSYHCGSDGEWILNSNTCQCKTGYQSNFERTECTECPLGTYKRHEGMGQCVNCPENSSSSAAASECSCNSGVFRSDYQSVDEDCKSVPAKVKNLSMNRTETSINLTWDQPRNGSREKDDLKYRISCLVCDSIHCNKCQSDVFWPKNPISSRKATISNISPLKDYKIQIHTESSITEKASRFGFESEMSEIFSYRLVNDQIHITNIEILDVKTSIAQFQVHLAPESTIIDYDTIEILLSQNNDAEYGREIRSSSLFFPLGMLQENTSYSMKVKVSTGIVESNWSEEIHFRTSSNILAEAIHPVKPQTGQWIAGIITGVVILIIFIVLIAVIIHRRKNETNQWLKGTRSSIEQFSVMTSSSAAQITSHGTVDLIPRRINASLNPDHYNEIQPCDLTVMQTLRAGRWGKVHSGALHGRDVLIKVLERSSENYEVDLKIFSQFEHINVARIEGFVTPVAHSPFKYMIVMERYDTNLTSFFQQSANISFNTLNTLRDLTSGLAFIHSQGFVLRQIDTDHIMLNSGDKIMPPVFKIRLASKTEHEPIIDEISDAEKSEHISIRQVAPEIFGNSRFSQQSDIWSFGILMWSICCMNVEEPYWGLTVRQVVDAVTSGWRLPLPPTGGGNNHYDDSLHRTMLQCWDQNPDARPNSTELRYKIEQLLQSPSQFSPGIAV